MVRQTPIERSGYVIHRFDDGTCGLSEDQVWIPGIFENEFAARDAISLTDETISVLQHLVNQHDDPASRTISHQMVLRELNVQADAAKLGKV